MRPARLAYPIAASLLAASLAAGCATAGATAERAAVVARDGADAARARCPRLRPPLTLLADAPDPAATAAGLQIQHDGAGARVSMRTSRDDADLAGLYGARVLSRTALGWLSIDVVQALVPFDRLCPLAADWRILRIEAVRSTGGDGSAPAGPHPPAPPAPPASSP